MKFQETLNQTEAIYSQVVNKLKELDNQKTQLTTLGLKLEGKIELLKGQIKEEQDFLNASNPPASSLEVIPNADPK